MGTDPAQEVWQSKNPERAMENPGTAGAGPHGQRTHPVPAPSGQAASIRAEAAAAYGAHMPLELRATGKAFCLLWQCQQLPWPQQHHEILCIGNEERGRFSETGNETHPGGQRKTQSSRLRMVSEGTAPREQCSGSPAVDRTG